VRTSEDNIEFRSQGVTCRGIYVRPAARRRAPLVVLAHGLGGVYEMRLDAYARRFAQAGYAALTFDYRHFGRSDGHPRHLLVREEQQRDIEAAIDFGKTLDGVDAEQVVLWGTSLGGGHVLDVASRRKDIAASIIQAPFTDGLASMRAASLPSVLGTLPFFLADLLARLVRRPRVLALLAAPPLLPALMTKPDVVEGVLALLPPGSRMTGRLSRLYRRFAADKIKLPEHISMSELEEPSEGGSLIGSIVLPSGTALLNGVSANFLLDVPLWRPGKNIQNLRSPILVCACEKDSVAPVGSTVAHAKRGSSCELRLYPYRHFEIYVGEPFEVAIRDQLAFLERVVPTLERAEDDHADAANAGVQPPADPRATAHTMR
jgi:pimeloyl-ACP methyl ester carboxylesterase